MIEEGFCFFSTGGALGFDTLAAEAVLGLRQEFPGIRLILVLPCRDQTRGWKQENIIRYNRIRAEANKVVYTSEYYAPGCMYKRNRYLIDNSQVCIAYCTRSTGKTARSERKRHPDRGRERCDSRLIFRDENQSAM